MKKKINGFESNESLFLYKNSVKTCLVLTPEKIYLLFYTATQHFLDLDHKNAFF